MSTGALIAPFAFLGPAYDDRLRALYKNLSEADVAVPRPLLALLSADSLAETASLARLIEANFTADMMGAIGREHAKVEPTNAGGMGLRLCCAKRFVVSGKIACLRRCRHLRS